MSAAALTRDLVITHTRALKLPGMARTFEGLARQARDAHWPHEDYLQEVLSAELASRHESVIRQRLREARFPEVKTLDTFDFPAADGVNATQIHTLARGEWVTAPENLILAGPIGTGKTHLAIALGVEATKQNAASSSPARLIWCASSWKPAMPVSSRACSSGCGESRCWSLTNATSAVMWSEAAVGSQKRPATPIRTPHYW
jgi:hypothetical protein